MPSMFNLAVRAVGAGDDVFVQTLEVRPLDLYPGRKPPLCIWTPNNEHAMAAIPKSGLHHSVP
jgi:hypothetical protein